MTGCPDCGKEQRNFNDKLKQAVQDAKVYANTSKVSVVVYPTETGFKYAKFGTYQGTYIYQIHPEVTGH